MSRHALHPIMHKDAHTAEVERELVAWFREAVFMPLVIELENHDIRTRNNEAPYGSWVNFPSWIVLGPQLDRCDLPQIPAGQLTEFQRHLADIGVTSVVVKAHPSQFRPSQDGYWTEKLAHAKANGQAKPVIVSSDGIILDGHHHWYAALEANREMLVLHCDLPFAGLRKHASDFAGSHRENALEYSAVDEALRNGQIWYANGAFSGKFNAAISRELREAGAVFDPVFKRFLLPAHLLPYRLKNAVAESVARSKDAHAAVLGLLAAILLNLEAPQRVEVAPAAEKVLTDLGVQFDRTTATLDAPAFSAEDRRRLTEELTENVSLSIKNFTKTRIPELRRRVELNLAQGGDPGRLADILESEFGFAKRRAKFIAEQETSLLIAKYREHRYKMMGSQSYIWQDYGDHKVRPGHKALNGREFFWESPPVVDPASGRRCHPGEDYNCRCAPRPIINILAE